MTFQNWGQFEFFGRFDHYLFRLMKRYDFRWNLDHGYYRGFVTFEKLKLLSVTDQFHGQDEKLSLISLHKP